MAQEVFKRPSHDPRSMLLKLAEKKKCRKFIWIIIPLAILLAVLLLGMKLLAGPGTLGHAPSGADDFSPYSTLTFPVSGLYCDSYTLTIYRGSATEALSSNMASIFILKESPLLSSEHNFSIYRGGNKNMITLNPGEFYQWSVSLHAGSSYEVNSCVWEGPEVDLYVIRGQASFREWIVTKDNYYEKMSLKQCNQTQNEQYNIPQPRSVTNDGKYYFVYFSLQSTTALQKGQGSQVQVDMFFNKLEYSLNESNVYCYRKAEVIIHKNKYQSSYETCDIPLTFSGFVLIKTTSPKVVIDRDMNWEDKIHVTWSCDGSYNAYLLLFCLPIMLLYIVGLLCSDLPKLLVCCCKCGAKKIQSCTIQLPVWISCKMPLIALLFFLRVLLALLACLTFMFILLPIVLKVFSSVSKEIPGLSINDLKLSLLAIGSLLFVAAFFCNKFKGWIQTKVDDLGERLNVSICNISIDTAFNLYMISFAITMAVTLIAFFTFLEGFYPVLSQYGSETDYDIYSPEDSRVFSFNSFFCSEYSISGYGSPNLSGSLHILGPSSLVQTRSISQFTSNETISAGLGAIWNFYLSSNSSGNMSICIIYSEYSLQYAVLEITPYDSSGIAGDSSFYSILDYCNFDDLQPIPIKERLMGHAGYYFVRLSTDLYDSVNVTIDVVLDRYEYSIKSDIDIGKQMCSISSHTKDTCSVSAPSTAGSMSGLIIVDSESNGSAINWHETFSIKKTCKYHWATWTALWLPVLLINITCCSLVCGGFQIAICRAGRSAKKSAKEKASKTNTTETESLLRNPTTNGYGGTAVTNQDENPQDNPTDPRSVVVVEVDVETNASPSGPDSHSAVEVESSQPSPTLESIPVDDGTAINGDEDAPLLSQPSPMLKSIPVDDGTAINGDEYAPILQPQNALRDVDKP